MEAAPPSIEKKKEEKYDRQLRYVPCVSNRLHYCNLTASHLITCRLWGAEGQAKLEKSHICLINANATGTEILKNLVLPGEASYVLNYKVQQQLR